MRGKIRGRREVEVNGWVNIEETETIRKWLRRLLFPTLPFTLQFHPEIQCLQSSLAQEGGANHWQLCITDLPKTLKTLKGRSKELPDVFEIVLRPIWWVAGCEQPSPPLPPPMVGGVLTKSRAAAASLALHQDFFAPSKPYFPISVQIIFLIWTENWNNGISNSFNQHCTHLSSVFVKAVNLIFTFQTWSFWALLHKSFCQSKEQVELLNIKSKYLLLLPVSDKRKFTL